MRKMPIAELCGAKTEGTNLKDLAMAHRVVSGLESLPKRIGRERKRQDILITQFSGCSRIICIETVSVSSSRKAIAESLSGGIT
jgi:hypothetical protein